MTVTGGLNIDIEYIMSQPSSVIFVDASTVNPSDPSPADPNNASQNKSHVPSNEQPVREADSNLDADTSQPHTDRNIDLRPIKWPWSP